VTELEDRLARCFSSIFPALTDAEIRGADVEALIDADSLAAVTLVSLIDQEFGVELDLEILLRLRTFDGVRQYLYEQRLSNLAPQEETVK
jgi:acyl carrier protein